MDTEKLKVKITEFKNDYHPNHMYYKYNGGWESVLSKASIIINSTSKLIDEYELLRAYTDSIRENYLTMVSESIENNKELERVKHELAIAQEVIKIKDNEEK